MLQQGCMEVACAASACIDGAVVSWRSHVNCGFGSKHVVVLTYACWRSASTNHNIRMLALSKQLAPAFWHPMDTMRLLMLLRPPHGLLRRRRTHLGDRRQACHLALEVVPVEVAAVVLCQGLFVCEVGPAAKAERRLQPDSAKPCMFMHARSSCSVCRSSAGIGRQLAGSRMQMMLHAWCCSMWRPPPQQRRRVPLAEVTQTARHKVHIAVHTCAFCKRTWCCRRSP